MNHVGVEATIWRHVQGLEGHPDVPVLRHGVFGLCGVECGVRAALKPKTMLDEVVIGHMVSSTEFVFDAWGAVGTYPQPATHRDRVGVAGHVGSKSAPRATGWRSSRSSRFSFWPFPVLHCGSCGSFLQGIAVLHAANIGAWWCWPASRRPRPSGLNSTTTTPSPC